MTPPTALTADAYKFADAIVSRKPRYSDADLFSAIAAAIRAAETAAAEAARTDEREACAMLAETKAKEWENDEHLWDDALCYAACHIRARTTQPGETQP